MSDYPVLDRPLPVVRPHDFRLPASFVAASERVWRTAEAKLRATVEKYPGRFPLYTEGGVWALDGHQWTRWGDGFLGGALWLVSAHGEDRAWFRQRAERYTRLVEGRKADDRVHDHGFLFWPTYYRWYRETQDPAHLAVLVEAARTLAGRFREPGRYLPSFLGPESLFIDIMMNVHLVLFAASVTGDRQLARVGHEHSLTTRRFLMRGDGSASHAGIFDVQTGAFIRQTSEQGFTDAGSWARGQAWAIHGFGTVYRFTGDRRFLATAVSAADFYLESTGDRLVPPNDWTEPRPARPFESSAAAAAAAGLWQLAGLVPDARLAGLYADYAVRILVRLSQDDFLASLDEPWEGVLKHGSYHERLGLGVDESLIFGDYWLLAALSAVTQSFSAPGA